MKLRFRISVYCSLPTFAAVLFTPSSVLLAQCCGGSYGGGSAQPDPASRMMGPLNQPLRVDTANTSGVTQQVSYGGSEASAPPGTHSTSYGGTGDTFAPQRGEENDFTGNDQLGNGCGLKKTTCPPEPAGSGATAEGVNPATDQAVGSAATDSNLDKNGTSRVGDVLGNDGVSPCPMDRDGGSGSTLNPPAVNYSASLGETFDPGSGRTGVAGTLLPDGNALFDPSDKTRYAIRGVQVNQGTKTDVTKPAATDSTAGNIRTITISGAGTKPATTTLTQTAANVLTVKFFPHDPNTGLPQANPLKTTVIERQTTAPDQPNSYTKGYTFTVSYPDGESNATQVWTTEPAQSTASAKTKVISGNESKEWDSAISGNTRIVHFRRSLGGVLVRHTIDTYSLAPWTNGGEILTQSTVVVDGGGGDQTTTYTYWNTPNNLNHKRLQTVVHPDGSWVLSALDTDGLTSVSVRPYGSAPPPSVTPASANPYTALVAVAAGVGSFVHTAEYTTLTAPSLGSGVRPGGQLAEYKRTVGSTLVEHKERDSGAPDFLITWNGTDGLYTYDIGWKSQNSSSGQANLERMTGRLNQYPSTGDFLDRSYTLQEPESTGNVRHVSTSRQADSQSPDSFAEDTWRDQVNGRPLLSKKSLNGSVIELTEWVYETGGARRPVAVKVNGVETEAWAYPAPSLTNAVRAEKHARDGICTVTEYDAADRILLQTLSGAAGATVYGSAVATQVDVVTTWAYSSLDSGNTSLPGYTVVESVAPAGQAPRVTTRRYDGAGRMVSQQNPDGSARAYAFITTTAADNSIEHAEVVYAGTSPAGSPLTTTSYFSDGRIKSISGPAQSPQTWSYSVPAAYRETTTRYVSGQVAEARTTDGFGRTVSVQTPVSINSAGTAIPFTSDSLYDDDGHLIARSRPSPNGGAVWEVAQYTWASTGLTVESGVSPDETWASADMDKRKVLSANGIDAGIPGLSVSYLDPATGATASASVAFGWSTTTHWLPTSAGAWETVAARISKSPLSARPVASSVTAWSGHTAGAIPLGYLNDGGDVTTRAVARTPLTGLISSVLSTETRTLRTNSQFRKVVNRNGLDVAFSSPDAANAALTYNAWREPLADFSWETIPHWPKREINDATGLITARYLRGSTVKTENYTYFTSPSDYRAGRLRSSTTWNAPPPVPPATTPPPQTEKGVTYYHYNQRGQILASYGTGASTSIYTYDTAGRMLTLRTYRTAPSLPVPDVADTIGSAIQSAYYAATYELTSWVYGSNQALPLVRYKHYPGQSQAIVYGYNVDGSLATRDWKRTDGTNRLRTTYLYSDAGKLTAIRYGSTAVQSFGIGHALYTPSVLYTYDPAGRVRSRTEGDDTTAITTAMTSRFDGSPLTEDAVDGSGSPLAAGQHLRRTYDSYGRLMRLESSWGSLLSGVSTTGSGTASPAVTYSYGAADRLSSIASGGMTGSITRTSSQESLTVGFTGLYYSPFSTYNRILRNSSGQPQSHLASYTALYYGSPYTYTISDTPFTWDADRLAARGESDARWNYSYDAKGQVQSANKSVGTTVLNGTTSQYTYDDIGNRTLLEEGTAGSLRPTQYGANSLNQYSTINRPQTFDVTGKRTNTSATILVNPPTAPPAPATPYEANYQGLYFQKQVANTTAAGGDTYEPVYVTQNGTAITSDQGSYQYVGPAGNFAPAYDLDGNLLSDGRWTYTWDGENRLVKMVSAAWTQPGGGYQSPDGNSVPVVTLEFAYDGLSRRVKKKTIIGGVATMEGYVYDG